MTHFRPIALCNTIAKVIVKALAIRFKNILPNIITNNVLLSYKVHHFIKHKKAGREGFMLIKLDMMKTYDRIEWSFLKGLISLLNNACASGELKGELKAAITGILGIPEVRNNEKYLGLPISLGTSKKEIFSSIVEKVKAKGSSGKKKSIHWAAWTKLCNTKVNGGLDFKNLKLFNLAILSKQVWRLITDPDSQLAKIYKAKYFP
ncbi:hypothetical protein LIER_00886 [Lithospermum erythrorhizon]|uniref:Reverse transcriptase n=1 Tax=Lithospermum erythrorhizon TaxID=34254 RepID=A0AAV3NJ12_LITER